MDLVVGNGVTWDKFEPRTKIQENKIVIFCPSFKSVAGQIPFPTTQNSK